ncbi:MAG TPA: dihydroneopterin aldolase [Armatimonadota bacterium]|nr:dihydroneopterin aldolase [Armatimonadota bacterium]
MDKILINDLLVRCIIGVNEDERRNTQDVVINIVLSADLHTPGRTDRLEDTVNYSALKKRIVAETEQSHFYLVEALAERIADLCLAEPMVQQAQVTVEKPAALRFARSVGVVITRDRNLESP